mmetsp:Transcript_5734/g.12022  ORF Transcript_5734/g.12022 Transcript_5734/m.12022 type:complete len:266 (-) Transcript_5734:209-1006(-)
MICFLRESTPGRTHVPSKSTVTPHAFSTMLDAVGEDDRKVACSLSTSTMKRSTSSSCCSSAMRRWAATSASRCSSARSGRVVSTTEMRILRPPISKTLESIMTTASGLRCEISAFALSIATACACRSMPLICASSWASSLSRAVVVGERNSSESERMQESIRPAMVGGGVRPPALERSYRMLPVEQSGRTSSSRGEFVLRPHSLWWSMMLWIFEFWTPSGSSSGLLVSTMATCCFESSAPSSSGGGSTPSALSTYSVSRLSSPSR